MCKGPGAGERVVYLRAELVSHRVGYVRDLGRDWILQCLIDPSKGDFTGAQPTHKAGY